MDSKTCLIKALNHVQPEHIPVDFGATPVTGIHVRIVELLRRHFGLEDRPVKVCEPYQMLGEIEADLAEAMRVDVVGIPARGTIFGFANENYKEWKAPWGQVLAVSEHFNTSIDDNGDVLMYPQGDMNAPASGRMPKNGFFFDTIVRQEPIVEDELDPEDNLEEFGPLSEADIKHFTEQLAWAEGTGKGIIANMGGTAFGDIALVPAPFLKHPKGIRDIAEWYMSTAMRPDYVHAIFARQAEIAVENLKKFKKLMGDKIQAVFICGTDFGAQNTQFCSGETYDSLWAPYYKKVNDWIHANTRWKTFKHSCGAIVPLMSHIIESGFDIINPVQCSAAGMDPQMLKDTYGKDLTFWGGGVDTQKTLPFGTPEQVKDEVLSRCEIFGKDGGFVFNTIHNIQANVPIENVVAMLDALKQFNG